MNAPARKRRSPWDDWYRRTLPAYWLFLFCATHLPNLKLAGPSHSDWLVHMVGYGLLAFVLWRFAETFRRPLPPRFFWLALVGLAAYALFDELTQPFFGRSADVFDWLFDMLGVAAVLAALRFVPGLRRRPAPAGRAGEKGGD